MDGKCRNKFNPHFKQFPRTWWPFNDILAWDKALLPVAMIGESAGAPSWEWQFLHRSLSHTKAPGSWIGGFGVAAGPLLATGAWMQMVPLFHGKQYTASQCFKVRSEVASGAPRAARLWAAGSFGLGETLQTFAIFVRGTRLSASGTRTRTLALFHRNQNSAPQCLEVWSETTDMLLLNLIKCFSRPILHPLCIVIVAPLFPWWAVPQGKNL